MVDDTQKVLFNNWKSESKSNWICLVNKIITQYQLKSFNVMELDFSTITACNSVTSKRCNWPMWPWRVPHHYTCIIILQYYCCPTLQPSTHSNIPKCPVFYQFHTMNFNKALLIQSWSDMWNKLWTGRCLNRVKIHLFLDCCCHGKKSVDAWC